MDLRFIGEDDVMTVPANLTNCGRRMMIFKMGNWDPRKYSVEEIFKATLIVLEIGILEPRAQVLGGVVIFDLEGITMSHAWSITPSVSFRLKNYTLHKSINLAKFQNIIALFLNNNTLTEKFL